MLAISLGLICTLTHWAGPAHSAPVRTPDDFITPEELTDEHIAWAINTLVEALYAQRDPASDGWDRTYADSALATLNVHQTGQTTLAVYALLASGQSYQDPRLYPIVKWLRKQRPSHTYVRSLRCHVWALLPRSFGPELEHDAQVLMSTYGYESGSWGYSAVPLTTGYDNSLTQYGTLGLWEAAKRGKSIPERLWERIENHYLRVQLQGGGWNYRPGSMDMPAARGSMTAAGLTALFITQDYLHADEHLRPAQPPSKPELAIEQGLKWLDANFTTDNHPGAPGDGNNFYYFYYLYGIERVGLAGGIKRFGEHDWFREGAAAIINRLCLPVIGDDGAITGFTLTDQLPDTGFLEVPTVQISFALMFLSHGRAPIVVSKLQDDQYAWNNRPRDAANLARWLGSESEQRLSWQILDARSSFTDWMESPIVYLASHEAVPYAEQHLKQNRDREDKQRRKRAHESDSSAATGSSAGILTTQDRIKQYIDAGGLLLTSADIGSESFTKSILDLGSAMYPGARWRPLPNDHWAYTLSTPVKRPPELLGLTNGVRELIVHCPTADFGAALQVNDTVNKSDLYATLTNLYLYATQRGLVEPRLAAISSDAAGDTRQVTRPFRVWHGRYEGNWNPEPAADVALADWLRKETNRDLRTEDVRLADLQARIAQENQNTALHVLLWIRGVDQHDFTPDELAGLKQFTQKGGTILLESVGGTGRFAADAEPALLSIANTVADSNRPPDEPPGRPGRFRSLARHPVVTGSDMEGGFSCSRVSYRLYTVEHLGSKETRPRLRGFVTVNSSVPAQDTPPADPPSVPRLFVSREDLTFAQLGRPRWGISGYETDDARHILANLLIFSQN